MQALLPISGPWEFCFSLYCVAAFHSEEPMTKNYTPKYQLESTTSLLMFQPELPSSWLEYSQWILHLDPRPQKYSEMLGYCMEQVGSRLVIAGLDLVGQIYRARNQNLWVKKSTIFTDRRQLNELKALKHRSLSCTTRGSKEATQCWTTLTLSTISPT